MCNTCGGDFPDEENGGEDTSVSLVVMMLVVGDGDIKVRVIVLLVMTMKMGLASVAAFMVHRRIGL